jgi:hypothetical protein
MTTAWGGNPGYVPLPAPVIFVGIALAAWQKRRQVCACYLLDRK